MLFTGETAEIAEKCGEHGDSTWEIERGPVLANTSAPTAAPIWPARTKERPFTKNLLETAKEDSRVGNYGGESLWASNAGSGARKLQQIAFILYNGMSRQRDVQA
jgi:hypothetical protein